MFSAHFTSWCVTRWKFDWPVGTSSGQLFRASHELTRRETQILLTGVLQWARRGSSESLVNLWLINRALCYRNRKNQIIQAIDQYQNIDTHAWIYRYILPAPPSKCQNKNEKENIACWCETLVNKLAAHPRFYTKHAAEHRYSVILIRSITGVTRSSLSRTDIVQ
jgi:hypothetical protein